MAWSDVQTFPSLCDLNIKELTFFFWHGLRNFSLREREHSESKMAGEYCWATTQAARLSCRVRSSSGVMYCNWTAFYTHTHTYIYRKGGDCRICLVTPDSRRYWCCILAKSMWTKFFYNRKSVVTCHLTGKVDCVQCTETFVCFQKTKVFCRPADL